jgi:hypothetical protein
MDVRVTLDGITQNYSRGSVHKVIDKDLQFKKHCAACARKIVTKRTSVWRAMSVIMRQTRHLSLSEI